MYFVKTIGNYNVFITDIPVFIYANKMIVLDDTKFDMSDNVKDVLHRLEVKHVNDVTGYDKKQDVYYLRKGETIVNLVRKYTSGSIKLFIDGIANLNFTETSELAITLTTPITENKSIVFVQYTDPNPTESPSNADSSWKEPVATFSEISTKYPNPGEGWVVTVSDTNDIYRYDLETASWIYINKNDLINFTSLADAPNSYTGFGGKAIKVKSTEDGLEFGDAGAVFYTDGGFTVEGFEDVNQIIPYTGTLSRVTTDKYSGAYSLYVSGYYTDITSAEEEFTLSVLSEGIFSFAYKIIAEVNGYIRTKFILDDIEILSVTNTVDWTVFSQNISSGTHTFKVVVTGNTFQAARNQTWIDNISIPAAKTYHQGIGEHKDMPLLVDGPNKLLKVNELGTAVEFIDVPTIPTKITELIDVPDSYTGNEGKFIKVNAEGTALEFGETTSSSGVSKTGTGIITTTDWVANTGDYAYKLDITITGIVDTDMLSLIIDADKQDIASACELCSTADTYNGGITIYAKSIPTEEISFTYVSVISNINNTTNPIWIDWTPILIQGIQLTLNMTQSYAKYYKIGNIAFFRCHLVPSTSGTESEPIKISGIPSDLQTSLTTELPTEYMNIGYGRWANSEEAHITFSVVAESPSLWSFRLPVSYMTLGDDTTISYGYKKWDMGDSIDFQGFVVV